MMSLPAHLQVHFASEEAAFDAAIDALVAEAFGPGRFAKAAARVREMAQHDRALSFVALRDGVLVGTVRQTRILIGDRPAVMLGPLAVRPSSKGKGAGRALMALAADAARASGETAIVLVGDRAYYEPLGYQPLARNSIVLPRPAAEDRILGLPLVPGALDGLRGEIRPR